MAANRQSPAVAGYFEKADTFGRLTKVSKRFGRMREITLKKYDGERFWLHISDNSKCFNAGTKSFDISRSTTVSISYEEGIELKNIIGELEGYRSLMNGQTMMVCFFELILLNIFIQVTLYFYH